MDIYFICKKVDIICGGAMKIVFQAFHWDCQCPAFSLVSFLHELNQMNGTKIKQRILYFIKEDDDLWVGLVLTIKDMRKFVTLVESREELKLDVHELSEGEKIADFNFFVIRPESGFGLYQHYHHSCSLNLFNYLVKKRYNGMRIAIHSAEKQRLENANAKKSTIKKELKKYTGKFTPTIVERKGSFVDRVKELQDTNSAELEFRQINFSNNPLQPIQAHLKTVKYKMSFSSTTSTLDKVRSLSSIIQSNDFKKATVEGIDENGNDVVYRLFNDFDRFQEYDYEDMVPSLNLDPDGLTDSILQNTIVSELKSVFLTIRPALES